MSTSDGCIINILSYLIHNGEPLEITAADILRTRCLSQGGHKVGEKNSEFSRLPIVPSFLADIYWAGSLLSEILMILLTQSTAVLHKYLNDRLKILCLLQFFPNVAQHFPCSEKSLSIPRFPGVWPPCFLSPTTSKH